MCSTRSVGDTLQRNVMQCSGPFLIRVRAFPCYCDDESFTTLTCSPHEICHNIRCIVVIPPVRLVWASLNRLNTMFRVISQWRAPNLITCNNFADSFFNACTSARLPQYLATPYSSPTHEREKDSFRR